METEVEGCIGEGDQVIFNKKKPFTNHKNTWTHNYQQTITQHNNANVVVDVVCTLLSYRCKPASFSSYNKVLSFCKNLQHFHVISEFFSILNAIDLLIILAQYVNRETTTMLFVTFESEP